MGSRLLWLPVAVCAAAPAVREIIEAAELDRARLPTLMRRIILPGLSMGAVK